MSNHRSGHTQSRGQSRGAQRATEEKLQGTRASQQRADPGTYNTIQHQKSLMPMKPSAQLGNYVQGFANHPAQQMSANAQGLAIRPQYSNHSNSKEAGQVILGQSGPSIHVTQRGRGPPGAQDASKSLNSKQLQLYESRKFNFPVKTDLSFV